MTIATLVAEGFALATVVYFTLWGITLPVRWFFRVLGFTTESERG